MQLRRLGLFEARVPRYTSYPTANHFSKDIEPEHFSGWLNAVPNGAEISLYVHVPFCRRLCWFCACRTQGTTTAEPVAAYVETLLKELELVRAALPSGVKLSRLHWGGGTPTIMTANQIETLAGAIFAAFPMADSSEFSVEVDPNEIDEERLDALAAAGLTRASIGIQDFDPLIQKTIGREQSFAVTKMAADGLRARGIDSLNVDILYGLPHQTTAGIADSVQRVLSLNPDRVALYGYAHVPWMARRQALIPTDALPRPETRFELFETAAKLFDWDGYQAIGIDHFARPDDNLAKAAREGRLNRNFQGYTDDQAKVLVGMGASSISMTPEGYAQNAPATGAWAKAIQAGNLATFRGLWFSRDDKLRGAAIERIMCDFAVDRRDICARTGANAEEVEAVLGGLARQFPEVVSDDGTIIRILPGAEPAARVIARALDAWDVKADGHSLAV